MCFVFGVFEVVDFVEFLVDCFVVCVYDVFDCVGVGVVESIVW